MPVSLEPILPHIPALLLVMFRFTGLFIFAPLLGSTAIPMQLKVLLTLVLTICIYPVIPPQLPVELSVLSMAGAVAAELTIGLIIGWGASLPMMAMQMGGLMMGQQLGLDVAQLFNPDIGDQASPLSQLYFLFAVALFLLLDGHHLLIEALVASFSHVPLGAWRPDYGLLQAATGLLTSMFDIGFRVAAPLLGLVFLETIALGFIAKTVPQLNILSLGFPLRILLGLLIFIATVAALSDQISAFILQTLHRVLYMITG